MAGVLNRLLPRVLVALSLCAVMLAACTTQDASSHAGPLTVVQVDPQAPAPFQLAVQACAGLHNRKAGGSVYLQVDAHDPARDGHALQAASVNQFERDAA